MWGKKCVCVWGGGGAQTYLAPPPPRFLRQCTTITTITTNNDNINNNNNNNINNNNGNKYLRTKCTDRHDSRFWIKCYVLVVCLLLLLLLLGRKECLFNDALNTFYLRLYGVGYMVKKTHSDSERVNPLPPLHGLLFPINSKGYFLCTIPQDSTGWNEK